MIENSLFRLAKKEAWVKKTSLSEVISYWARMGREHLIKKKGGKRKLKTVDLGGRAAMDINSRKEWIDLLE